MIYVARTDQSMNKKFINLMFVLVLLGCSGNPGNLAQLSTSELTEQADWCSRVEDPAPGAAISCGNIERECKRRSGLRGYKLC